MSISLSAFADRVNEIMPMVAKEFVRYQPSELSKGNITLPQCLILNFLGTSGETKMKDLAKFMRVTTAAMTGLVDRLVRYGYAERVFDPNDRRVIKIRATAKGSALVKKVNAQKRQMVINIFSKISQQDREEYLRIITKIRDMLAEERR